MKNQAMTLKQLFLLTLVIFLGIQFIPVERTNPPVETTRVGSEPVMKVFRNACFNCHSNETEWPWYGKVAPFSWLITRDVKAGRAALNFSTWNRIPLSQQDEMRVKIWNSIKFGDMPPPLYTLGHPEAPVTTDHHARLKDWAGIPPN